MPAGRMTNGIVRRGDQLRRPMGPWSPAVHEYLRYLEAAGFDGLLAHYEWQQPRTLPRFTGPG